MLMSIFSSSMIYIIPAVIVGLVIFSAIFFRVVVPTNYVHIVQSSKKTVSYGKGKTDGNTYYRWPSWVPILGVKTIELPISVFPIEIKGYPAYDVGRVPFVIDILAFFRISDSNTAAERVSSFGELMEQLEGIMKGAVRTVLAKADIEEILGERAVFGKNFTDEVQEQLRQWGVEPVKNLELMDIRDDGNSKVITSIQAKKESLIANESRQAIAKNNQEAELSEIVAKQSVQIRQQEADEAVGKRTAEKNLAVGIAGQKTEQAIAEESKNTTTKKMEVLQIEKVREAEIQKAVNIVDANKKLEVALIDAEASKKSKVIEAEGQKAMAVTVAEGAKESAMLAAEATAATGKAIGEAETAKNMADITPQISLAKEIGENVGYQTYLTNVKNIEANRDIGIAQAKAMEAADIKIVATGGTPTDGLNSARDMFSAKGGANIGAMLEAFLATEAGQKIAETVLNKATKK